MKMSSSTFDSFLFPLVIIPVSITLFLFLINLSRKKSTTNLPPGLSGWPILGENIEFANSGPQAFTLKRMKKYSSDIFKTSLLGHKMAVFCGPQGNKFLFTNENKLVASWWPESGHKVLMFPEPASSELTPINKYMQDNFKPEALKRYVPGMDSMIRHHMEHEWAPKTSEVKVVPLARIYAFALACKLFMNVQDTKVVERLLKHFDFMSNGMVSIAIDLPGTAYNIGRKHGKVVREELLNIIATRKEELTKKNEDMGLARGDPLSQMILENRMSDKAICNRIVGLLIASYETTSAAVAIVLKFLAELPEVYDQVLKEQMAIAKSKAPGELLKWEDVEKMKYSWNMAREAMRLIPPAHGAFREVIQEFTYAGFTVPKGWKTYWTGFATHKNPKYFPEPEKFDPSRFEGKGPAPYTFVPFGGGPRMCPGKEYARLEVLVFMYNVVTRFKLEKLIPNEKIMFRGFPKFSHGLPVRLIPHDKRACF